MSKNLTKIQYINHKKNNDFHLLFDLGGSTFRSILMDENFNIKKGSLEIVKTKNSINTIEKLVNMFAEKIIDNINNNLSKQKDYFLSIAGPVMKDRRTVVQLTNILPDKLNLPLSDLVEKKVFKKTGKKINLFLINDGVTGSVAELAYGSSIGSSHSISLIVGTGIGGVDVIKQDNKIQIAQNIIEPGHWILNGYNKETLCNCGKRGCIETQAGSKYLSRIASRIYKNNCGKYKNSYLMNKNYINKKINGFSLEKALILNDHFAIKLLQSITKPIAILIGELLTRYPELNIVLIGGLAINLDPKYLNCVKEHLCNMSFDVKKINSCIKTGIIPPSITNFVGNMVLLKQAKTV